MALPSTISRMKPLLTTLLATILDLTNIIVFYLDYSINGLTNPLLLPVTSYSLCSTKQPLRLLKYTTDPVTLLHSNTDVAPLNPSNGYKSQQDRSPTHPMLELL